jgi:hypothetical protein
VRNLSMRNVGMVLAVVLSTTVAEAANYYVATSGSDSGAGTLASSVNNGLRLSGTEGVAGTAKYLDGFYGVTAPQLLITLPEPSSLTLIGIAGLMLLAIHAASHPLASYSATYQMQECCQ